MIDFLKDNGFGEFDIQEIEEANSKANLYNLNCNELEVVKMIDYLREKNVTDIKILFMNNIDVFFTSYDEFVNKFEKDL